jgi:hypothetical protein
MKKKLDHDIVVGMMVYSAAHVPIGTIEEVDGDEMIVNGERLPVDGITQALVNSVYLSGTATALLRQNEIIPAAEANFGAAVVEGSIEGVSRFNRPAYGPEQVVPGVQVYSLDDHFMGDLREVGETTIKVHRLLRRDLHIPYSAILEASDTRVVLNLTEHDAEKGHWPEGTPDLETNPQMTQE